MALSKAQVQYWQELRAKIPDFLQGLSGHEQLLTAGPSLEIKTSGRSVRHDKLGSRTIAAPCKSLTAKGSRIRLMLFVYDRIIESASEARRARASARCGRLADLPRRIPELWHLLGLARPARGAQDVAGRPMSYRPRPAGADHPRMEFLECIRYVDKIWNDRVKDKLIPWQP